MPAKEVIVGDLKFARKQDAVEHFRRILYKYSLGERVVGTDEAQVKALFLRHPDAQEKMDRKSISHFEISSNIYGTRSFYLIRADGSRDDFGMKYCL